MVSRPGHARIVAPLLVLAGVSIGCEPELVIGKKVIAEETCTYEGAAGAGPEDKVIEIGWTTGFENGTCDYDRAGGLCYALGNATQTIVHEPTHGGRSAAAFSVTTDTDPTTDIPHTRCFLEGVLPRDAVYGAWFYLPEPAKTGNWNLIFFQGAAGPGANPALFSVSLASAADGSVHLYVLNHMTGVIQTPDPASPVPIASWFRVEFRLLRATDATGAIALYQNETLILEDSALVTDAFDAHQWFVGNWADALTPPESTVYVDDVTVRAGPGE